MEKKNESRNLFARPCMHSTIWELVLSDGFIHFPCLAKNHCDVYGIQCIELIRSKILGRSLNGKIIFAFILISFGDQVTDQSIHH